MAYKLIFPTLLTVERQAYTHDIQQHWASSSWNSAPFLTQPSVWRLKGAMPQLRLLQVNTFKYLVHAPNGRSHRRPAWSHKITWTKTATVGLSTIPCTITLFYRNFWTDTLMFNQTWSLLTSLSFELIQCRRSASKLACSKWVDLKWRLRRNVNVAYFRVSFTINNTIKCYNLDDLCEAEWQRLVIRQIIRLAVYQLPR